MRHRAIYICLTLLWAFAVAVAVWSYAASTAHEKEVGRLREDVDELRSVIRKLSSWRHGHEREEDQEERR